MMSSHNQGGGRRRYHINQGERERETWKGEGVWVMEVQLENYGVATYNTHTICLPATHV